MKPLRRTSLLIGAMEQKRERACETSKLMEERFSSQYRLFIAELLHIHHLGALTLTAVMEQFQLSEDLRFSLLFSHYKVITE